MSGYEEEPDGFVVVSGGGVRAADERAFPGGGVRLAGVAGVRAAAVHGAGGGRGGTQAFLVVALRDVRGVECGDDVLGVQCDGRGRDFRRAGQCVADVAGVRAVPLGEAAVPQPRPRIGASVSVPGGGVDRVGEVLSHGGGDFVAVAGAGECVRRDFFAGAVV